VFIIIIFRSEGKSNSKIYANEMIIFYKNKIIYFLTENRTFLYNTK